MTPLEGPVWEVSGGAGAVWGGCLRGESGSCLGAGWEETVFSLLNNNRGYSVGDPPPPSPRVQLCQEF